MRARFGVLAVLAAAGGLSAALFAAGGRGPSGSPVVEGRATAVATTPSGWRIHAIRTGFVRVKSAHRDLRVPAALRIPAIVLDPFWAEWMPIFVYVVEHPERTVLVDTGPPPGINDPDFYARDPGNGWFYHRNLRVALPPGEDLAERLAAAGIDAAAVRDVVVTHFHGDHVGGFDLLPNATAHVGAGWSTHVGSLTVHLPAAFSPRVAAVDADGRQPLTADGGVSIVALPGHTPGHLGLLVEDGGQRWIVAGDATFDPLQTGSLGVAGVSEDVAQARATQARLRDLVREGAFLLPSHDPAVPDRLAASSAR